MFPPSTNGDNGRTASGQFAPGNRLGRGNPHLKRVAAYRRAFLAAVRPRDIRAVVRAMLDAALAGDTVAARLILERTVGDLADLHDAGAREELRRDAQRIVERIVDVLQLDLPEPRIARLFERLHAVAPGSDDDE